jgi:hypothetical protein
MFKKRTLAGLFFYCISAITVVLCAETFIFNYSSVFAPSLPASSLDLTKIKASPNDLSLSQNSLQVNPQSSSIYFYFDDINIPSETVTFDVSSRISSVVDMKVYLKDQVFDDFMEVYNILFSPNSNKQTVFVKIKSSGNLNAAGFAFSKKPGADLIISNFRLNQAKPFHFSFLRFFLILFVVLFVIFANFYRWQKYETDFKDKVFIISSAAVLAFCIFISFSIFRAINTTSAWLNQKSSYPFINLEAKIEDPYLLLFDAFKKGQTWLDIKPAPKLVELENPYNPGARKGMKFYGDYAFFNGKYYVYFGLAPLFLVYYPSYIISGSLPSMNFAGFVLALFALIAFFFAYKQLVYTFCRRANLFLFHASFLAIVSGSLLFVLQADSYRYEFPNLSAYLFLSLSVLFSFAAHNNLANKKYFIYLALAGFSFASILTTRPHCILIAFAFLIPLYMQTLFDKSIRTDLKIKGAFSFLIPCFVVIGLVCLYNAIRFDSPLSFGHNYNLTVTNLSAATSAKMSLSNLFASIFYYFLDMPSFSAHFPFIHIEKHFYNLTGVVTYTGAGTQNIGLLCFPLFLALFAGGGGI